MYLFDGLTCRAFRSNLETLPEEMRNAGDELNQATSTRAMAVTDLA